MQCVACERKIGETEPRVEINSRVGPKIFAHKNCVEQAQPKTVTSSSAWFKLDPSFFKQKPAAKSLGPTPSQSWPLTQPQKLECEWF